jgi:hypothetical protein
VKIGYLALGTGRARGKWQFATVQRLTREASNNMTETLASKTCTPCRGGVPPLTREQAQLFHAQAPDWQLQEEAHRIERSFRFRNFREALTFVQEIGELAQRTMRGARRRSGHQPYERAPLHLRFWHSKDRQTCRRRVRLLRCCRRSGGPTADRQRGARPDPKNEF